MNNPPLDQRNPNENICFTDCTPCDELPVGCTVTLKSGDVSIIATVKNWSDTACTGVVQCFENWNQPEWNGWCTGTEITFDACNVFSCNTKPVAA